MKLAENNLSRELFHSSKKEEKRDDRLETDPDKKEWILCFSILFIQAVLSCITLASKDKF